MFKISKLLTKKVILILLSIIFALLIWLSISIHVPRYVSKDRILDYSWTKHKLVAHALGEYKGRASTNSIEALEENYKKGYRLFEMDLLLTKDGVLVGRHDWDEYGNKAINLKDFKNNLNFNCENCTPTTFKEIALFMKTHKDMYLITDTKSYEKTEVKNAFNYIKNNSSKDVIKRIIPQFYKEKMLKTLESIYPFESYIYTLYMGTTKKPRLIKFVLKNKIKVVTSPRGSFNKHRDLFNKSPIYIYLHTFNNINEINNYQKLGAYGFYTDSVTSLK